MCDQLPRGGNSSRKETDQPGPRADRVVEQALAQPKVELMPLTPPIAVKATQLGRDFPGDPANRLIVATTILESATLITKDSRIRDYLAVNTIW